MIEFLMFLLGFVSGIFTLIIIVITYMTYQDRKEYLKPIKSLLKLPVKEFKFVNRVKNYVKIENKDYIFYLNLTNQELIIYKGEQIAIVEHRVNKSHMKSLYKKLETGFKKEIYENVVVINGSVLSTNQLTPTQQTDLNVFEPNLDLDEILDKINTHGVDSLNEKELQFLRDQSKEE